MSGGHWGYRGSRIQDSLETMGSDPEVTRRFPVLARIFISLGETLGTIEHDLDWDLSGDSHISDDQTFERGACDCLRRGVRKD